MNLFQQANNQQSTSASTHRWIEWINDSTHLKRSRQKMSKQNLQIKINFKQQKELRINHRKFKNTINVAEDYKMADLFLSVSLSALKIKTLIFFSGGCRLKLYLRRAMASTSTLQPWRWATPDRKKTQEFRTMCLNTKKNKKLALIGGKC